MKRISYADAAIQDTPTIFGLKLKPFSLGHLLLMEKYDCAFRNDRIERPKDFGVQDFLLALCICCRSFNDFQEFKQDEDAMAKWLAHWGKQIRKHYQPDNSFQKLLRKTGIRRAKVESFIDKFSMFKAYMIAGQEAPIFIEGDKDIQPEPSGTSWSHALLCALVGDLGYTHDEALNAPLSKTVFDYFRYVEKNGGGTFYSEQDAALEAMNKPQGAA